MMSYRPLPTPAALDFSRAGPRSEDAKRKQSAAMTAYYHQRGVSESPQARYMREWRRKRKAEGGRA